MKIIFLEQRSKEKELIAVFEARLKPLEKREFQIFRYEKSAKEKVLRQADIIGIIERQVMPNEYQDYFS